MSDSDSDDPNLPPVAECDRRCREFAAITDTDTALAMFFLQDRDWDLEKSISDYFQSLDAENGRSFSASTLLPIKDVPSLGAGLPEGEKTKEFVDPEPHRIRLMSWNIDGLDQNNIQTRAKAVCREIANLKPDVVFLQEVVVKNLDVIKEKCGNDYAIILGTEKGNAPSMQYFIVMLLRRNTVEYVGHSVTPFSGSIMSRAILHVVAKVKAIEMHLLTTHLESTREFWSERQRQMRIALQEACEVPEDKVVIFGGDLNLRDSEVEKIGHLNGKLADLWEETGRRPEARYTWDRMYNDNLDATAWLTKPRHRFDRLYYRSADLVKAVYFELVGFQKDPECKRFPSDHWGIMAHFNKVVSEEGSETTAQ